MDLGKIVKKGLGNLGSGILGNHKKGGITDTCTSLESLQRCAELPTWGQAGRKT